MSLAAHQLINQDSGNTEYYTPVEIVDAAREVMGGIDLDPASSHTANIRVRATKIFTIHDDGLNQEWNGRVWMNHPFGRVSNPAWICKLLTEFRAEDREVQFCNITFAATSEVWFKPLHSFYQCYLSPRTNYYLPDGSLKRGVSKGSVVTYGGPNPCKFADVFARLGAVKIPCRRSA